MRDISNSNKPVEDIATSKCGGISLSDLSSRIDGSKREPIVLIPEDERLERPIEELRLQSSIAVILSGPINYMKDTLDVVEKHLNRIETLNPREESLPERPHATTYLIAEEAKITLINDGWKPVSIAEWRAEGLTKDGATIVLLNSIFQPNREEFARNTWQKAYDKASVNYEQGASFLIDTLSNIAPSLRQMIGTPTHFGDIDPTIIRHFVETHPDQARELVSKFRES